MSHATISLLVLGGLVALFAWNRFPPKIVAIAGALALYAAGVLGANQAIAGFGDPTVVFIAGLFVVSEGLDATGVTTWVGRELIARVGRRPSLLFVLTLLLIAIVAVLITPNGAAAALVPVAVGVALRTERSPSTFLMPVAFAASGGSLLALTGSPVNVIVSEALAKATHHGFSYLAFAAAGLPLVVGTIAICTLLGPRLLPQRRTGTVSPDLSAHARTLAGQYSLPTGRSRGPRSC